MNKMIMIPLAVVLGVLVGLAVLQKINPKHPALVTIVQQQKDIQKSQDRIEKKMNSILPGSIFEIKQGQEDLHKRILSLENKVIQLEKTLAVRSAGAQAPAAQRPQRPPEDYNTVYDIPVDHSYIIGKKDAPVTIVEFLDFQCPYCARFHTPPMEVVEKNPDKVNLIIKNFPLSFHPQSRPAAKAALAAGEQGKYGEMADLLLKNGRSLSEEKFKELAKELGLDVKKFMKDYKEKDKEWEEIIKKDMALGQKVGVRGTPTFFIGGKKSRARDVNSIQQEVEKALKEKK